jgi:hypothetical protein
MEAVDRVGNKRSRMRAGFTLFCPHPNPLPQGEGEKRHALSGDWISNLYFIFSHMHLPWHVPVIAAGKFNPSPLWERVG